MDPLAVEIVRAPEGEAPLWVREAWVGLTLPLVPGYPGKRRMPSFGVLSGPFGWWGQLRERLSGRVGTVEGYVVDRDQAYALLGAHRPDALAWWREECPGINAMPGGAFVFDAPACRPVYG